MNKISANINSLGTVIQNDILLNYFNGKTFKELSIEERQLFNNYFNEKKKEIESSVNLISNNPQYISWICDMLMIKAIKFPEDIEIVKELLNNYDEVKKSDNFPEEYKNILKFKAFGDLDKIVGEYLKKLSGREKVKTLGNNKVIYNKNGMQIVKLMDYEECSYLVENVAWCIKNRKQFYIYKPPFYMFVMDGKKYALLHLGNKELKDIHNDSFDTIDDNRFLEALKWVFDANNIDLKRISLVGDYEALFELLNDEQRDRHLISRKSLLSDKQFELCNDEQKKRYIDTAIYRLNQLSDMQFDYCNDDQKQRYINSRLYHDEFLSDKPFLLLNEQQKAQYIYYMLASRKEITDEQFKYCSKEEKNTYINYIINGEKFLTDKQFGYCNNAQKKSYIYYQVINIHNTISDYQFKLCDDRLKIYYIDIANNEFVFLTPLQKEYSRVNIKESSNRLWNSCFNNNYIGKL